MPDIKALSTQGVKLTVGGATYDLTDFPDLGSAPDMLDCTTCSDAKRTYIPGLQSFDNFVFTANYPGSMPSDTPVSGNPVAISVTYAPASGTGGGSTLASFNGYASFYLSGGGVNEVLKMKIAVTPTDWGTGD